MPDVKVFGEFISFSTYDRYIGLVQTFSDTVVHDSLIEKDGCVNIIRIKMFFHSVDRHCIRRIHFDN